MTKRTTPFTTYARVFDKTNINWCHRCDPVYTQMYLYRADLHCNEIFKHDGYITLARLYEEFGFPHTNIEERIEFTYYPNKDTHLYFGWDFNTKAALDEIKNGVIVVDFTVIDTI